MDERNVPPIVRAVIRNHEDAFTVGQSVILGAVQQLLAQGMPLQTIAIVARGMFSGSIAMIESLQGPEEVSRYFMQLVAATKADGQETQG